MLGPAGAREAYWKGMKGHVVYQRIAHLIDPTKHLALGFHGDGAPTSKTQSLFTISFNSLTGQGSTRKTRLVYTVVRKENLCEGALHTLWLYFVWAMNTLLKGYADEDWKGQPIKRRVVQANGCLFALVHGRGDWDYYIMPEVFNFSAWNTHNCCYKCGATLRGLTRWTGYGWRGTEVTHGSYLAGLVNEGLLAPVLFNILSLCHEGVLPDVLHIVDQCMACHICANVFVEVMEMGHWGSNHDDQMAGLAADMKAWYAAVDEKCKIQGELTFSRIRTSGDWPKLKAKAASTRHLTKYALYLCVRYDDGSIHSQRRKLVCELLVRFYTILDTHGRFFPQKILDELNDLGPTLFDLYMRLAEEALANKKRAWKMTPKFHVFLHICELSCAMENPRFHWTYSDEDLMQVMKKIALTCHAAHVEWLCLFKWIRDYY